MPRFAHPPPATRAAAALLGAGLAASALPLSADPPAVYAIRDAKIVPVSGPTLEHGTVVVRDGLIEAVGENVSIPGDARIIDGKGLTAYPGLIDASSELGLPAPPAAGTPDEGGSFRSFFRVAETATDGGIAAAVARQAGVTAVLSVPNRGVFAGQSAVLSLNGDRSTTVVRAPVALHVRFAGAGGREFPSSLMGILAYVRQGLADAARYRESWEIYRRDPRKLRRPETDRSLEALIPVIEGRMPLVLPGGTAPETQRALKVAEQSKVRIWLSGGGGSGAVAAELKRANVPVLLSVNYPARPTDPEAEESLLALRRRIEGPKSAVDLERVGVRFAFASGGAPTAQFVRNVGWSVRAGLSADAALRALTLSSAELLGVEQQLGSIEPGKIANLLVTDGDLFGEKTKVRHTFVDGKHYPAGAPDAPTIVPTPAAEEDGHADH